MDGKSNEITAVSHLLELLALPGMVVIADALHCQQFQQVVAQSADYALALKGNQGTSHHCRLACSVTRASRGSELGFVRYMVSSENCGT